ncbi:MAG: AAC(3) family N-acetyltransferase [Tannerella sp.]|jgi:aminoglycoside 3-N-acetyltransferase|nr:AAC(3) family N-acetyltransferase [Tannerella sp.]
MIKKIIHKLLPEDKVKKLRYKYRLGCQKLYAPMTEEDFRNVLAQKLGVKRGDTLFIHSSMDFLNIKFSPFCVLDILMDIVGVEGTLIFPSWHIHIRAEDYLQDDHNLFDIKHSRGVLGLLPELARRRPEAERSIHPINSIVAIGKNAKEIIAGHDRSIYPCGESSPYYKMLKFDARIIGIGVNANFLSFVHCPEDVMKKDFPMQTRTSQSYFGKVKLSTGEVIEVETLAAHRNIQKRNVPGFLKKHVPENIFTPYRIRGSDFFVADANALFHKMIELAKQNKTIYNS